MKAFLMVAAVVGVVAGQIKFPGGVCGGGGGGGRVGGGGGACDCQPISVCAISFDSLQANCQLGDGSEGVCCPKESAASGGAAARLAASAGAEAGMVNVNVRTQFDEPLVPVSQSELAAASQAGIAAVSSLASLEQSLVQANRFVSRGTPASGHLQQSRISQEARDMDKRAWAIVQASTTVMNDLNLPPRASGLGLRNVLVSQTPLRDQCPSTVSCGDPSSKFRTASGSCNNQANPAWGMSNTPTQRILPPTYDDGLASFRTLARDGSKLPGVRNISSTILVDMDKPDTTFTLSVMQWAQFMDHDFALVPFPSLDNGEGIECCSSDPSFPKHPRCMPINLTGDRFYSQFGRTCMNFVRSMLAVGPGRACTFGFAEQLNQLTHWIDGSMVYGSTIAMQRALRTMQNGLLSTSAGNMLPFNPNQGRGCEAGLRNAKCFLAGDSRVNEQPTLTVIHTLWMREHNRVATALQRINPQWNDEKVFHEARRIVVAEIQHITFNEWLPIIVGPNVVRALGLTVLRRGFSNDYNPTIKPNMNSEFSTAAFRFGHTLVQGTLALFSQNGQVSTVQLRNNFNSPHLIQNEGRFDDLVRSLVQFPSQSFDNFVTSDLTNHLFQTPGSAFGMDLMSLNIHRGRDHGIATYNSIREVCGLRRARDFDDLRDQINPRIIQRLQSLYRSVDDIDLFVGGISETPLKDTLLGPTFTCIVADQFVRLKKGDRFFYDLGGQAGSFKEPQLNEIRRTSWARILCDNSELTAVQPLAFQLPTQRFNRPRSCDCFSIPKVDLSVWRN